MNTKPIKNKEWRKKFHDKFTCDPSKHTRECDCIFGTEEGAEEVITFISTLLKAQKQEIMDKIKNAKGVYCFPEDAEDFIKGL